MNARLRRVPPRHGRAGNSRGGILFKLLALLALLFLLGVLYLLRHPLLRGAGGFWVVDQPPERSDAIIILSDDNEQAERAGHAAELYHAGWAPAVVASGRALRSYASIADLMQRDLLERGVPATAIVKFSHHARNTREEAEALRGLCRQRGWHRLIVVTSNYHTRRALYIFRRVMPAAVEVRVSAARDSAYDPSSWWHTREGVKCFFEEFVGLPVAMWELRHGSGETVAGELRLLTSGSPGY